MNHIHNSTLFVNELISPHVIFRVCGVLHIADGINVGRYIYRPHVDEPLLCTPDVDGWRMKDQFQLYFPVLWPWKWGPQGISIWVLFSLVTFCPSLLRSTRVIVRVTCHGSSPLEESLSSSPPVTFVRVTWFLRITEWPIGVFIFNWHSNI